MGLPRKDGSPEQPGGRDTRGGGFQAPSRHSCPESAEAQPRSPVNPVLWVSGRCVMEAQAMEALAMGHGTPISGSFPSPPDVWGREAGLEVPTL